MNYVVWGIFAEIIILHFICWLQHCRDLSTILGVALWGYKFKAAKWTSFSFDQVWGNLKVKSPSMPLSRPPKQLRGRYFQKRSTRQCSGSLLLFHRKSSLSKNNTMLCKTSLFMLWFPVRFGFLIHAKVTYLKKLDLRTFAFSRGNSGTQRYNDQISHQSKPLSFVPNQRLPYKLVDKTVHNPYNSQL